MSSPNAGYYPDPSIPGYIRYWNGSAWVPGTSRPAPPPGEDVPPPPNAAMGAAAPSVGAPPAPRMPGVEESGPMFLDEDPSAPVASGGDHTAHHADHSQRSGHAGHSGAPERPDRAEHPGRPEHVGGAGHRAGDAPGPDAAETPARPTFPEARGSAGPAAPAPPSASSPSGPSAFPEAAGPAAGRPPVVPGQPGERLPGGTASAARQGGPAQSSPGFEAGGAPAPVAQSPAPGGVAGAGVPWQRQIRAMAQPPGQVQPHPPSQIPPQGRAPMAEEQPAPWRPVAPDPFASSLSQARPAGLGQRLAARLVDGLIVGAAVAAAAVPLGSAAYHHIQQKIAAARLTGETVTVWLIDGTTGAQLGIVAAVLVVTGVLYEVVPTGKWGRTLGKKLFKLKVLDIDSQHEPGFAVVLRRWLAQTVLNILLIGVVSAAWCLFDRPWRQGWHDKLARTFVAEDA